MKRCRFLLLVLAVAAMTTLSSLAGCAEVGAQGEMRTIVDGAGREVLIPVHVERAVSLVTGITGIVYGVEGADKLVGTTQALPYPNYYYYPETENLPDVGSIANVDVEAVVALEPDVVFTTQFFVNQAQSVEDRGIPVVAIRTDTLADLTWNVRFVGSVLGQVEEAANLAGEMESKLSLIGERTQGLGDERPLVYVEGSRMTTYGASTYCNESIVRAGGVNVYGDSAVKMPGTNSEYVLERDPAYILIFDVARDQESFVATARERIDEMSNRAGWGSIDAIANGRICVIENRYLNFGPDHPDSVVAMGKFLHPELFEDMVMPDYAYVEGA